MNFDPQKFFIGLMDFLSILLPGALLTCLLTGEVGLVVLGNRYAELAGAQAWVAFLFASCLFRRLVFPVALHEALGNDPFVMRFGVRRARHGIGERDVVYLLFPGSAHPSEGLDAASIERLAKPLLDRFGGVERLQVCAGSMAREVSQ